MPIPFLQPKKMATMILARKGKPGVEVSPEVEAPGSMGNSALKDAMADLLSAIEHKSVIDMASAFSAACEACEASEPAEMEEGA